MGKYQSFNARAVSGDFGKSEKKGTRYVRVVFQTDGGDNYVYDGYFTENTTERVINALKTCGCTFPGDDITNLEGLQRNTVQIQVEDTDYGPRVAFVNAIGEMKEESRLAGAEKKAFASELRGFLRSGGGSPKPGNRPAPTGNTFGGGGPGAPWNPPAGGDGAPELDEDIPF